MPLWVLQGAHPPDTIRVGLAPPVGSLVMTRNVPERRGYFQFKKKQCKRGRRRRDEFFSGHGFVSYKALLTSKVRDLHLSGIVFATRLH